MSDFHGCLESTSFRMKDPTAFLADPETQRLKGYAESHDGFFEQQGDYFAFAWYDDWPSTLVRNVCIHAGEGEEDMDITQLTQRHILPGEVCRIQVSGNQKLVYVIGELNWVTSKGGVRLDAATAWGAKLVESDVMKEASRFYEQVQALLAGQERNA